VTSPLRVLRQIVAPTGRHRPKPVLLDADEIATHEDADCPRCERATAHAVNRDTSRRCWDCGATTPAGAA
jgi:hypothetical protein